MFPFFPPWPEHAAEWEQRVESAMPIAKKTSKTQITLPRSIVDRFPGVNYFEVREENGRIVLYPVRPEGADEVRRKLAALGIEQGDVEGAVRWARGK